MIVKTMVKPNFFIVGAPKAGTTSIFNYLKNHPEVFLPLVKEPNFFSHKELLSERLYYKESIIISDIASYEKLFINAKRHKAVGEASVSYLFYESVPQRIKQYSPNAKVIILLRNPIDRAYSHYLMDYRSGYIDEDFDKVVENVNWRTMHPLRYRQVIDLGFYSEQVERYLRIFSKRNVKIVLFDDLVEKSNSVMSQLADFLEIDKHRYGNINHVHNPFMLPRTKWIDIVYRKPALRVFIKTLIPKKYKNNIKNIILSKADKNGIDLNVRKSLAAMYLDDIKCLSRMIDRDLLDWMI